MENDPDAALVNSFFLPGGILDPESYEQDEKPPRQESSSNVETSAPPPPLAEFKGFSPGNIDPNNPWAAAPATTTLPQPPAMTQSPTMTHPQRESFLFPTSRSSPLFAPKRMTTGTNINSMTPHHEEKTALSATPIQNRTARMAPPPGFESSIPHPELVQSTFPAISTVEIFEEEDSIACSVPRELIPAHQEKDSMYGDGSSTSSLSHSTCGGRGRHGSSVQEEEEEEDILLEREDQQQVSNPIPLTSGQEEQCDQQNDTYMTEQTEEEMRQMERFQPAIDANSVDTSKKENSVRKRKGELKGGGSNGNSQIPEIQRTKGKIAKHTVKPAQPIQHNKIEVQEDAYPFPSSPPTETPSPLLTDAKHFGTKPKKRRGHKRAVSSSNKQKNQHHQSHQSPPLMDHEQDEVGPRKSNHSKVFENNRSKNHQKPSKEKSHENAPVRKARSMFSWRQTGKDHQTHHREKSLTKWTQLFSITQQQQQVIRIILLVISFTCVIIRAALIEMWTNMSSLFIYLFFWGFPYISTNLLVQTVCLPHWISQVTTLILIWELCTPTTSAWNIQWLWRLLRGRRGGKNKMENLSSKKTDVLRLQEQRLVLILYTFRIAAVGMFIYDGFSQPQSSILLYLAPPSRALVAYILLVIRRGWYQSPLLLLWSPLVQCLVKFIFYSSNMAVILNIVIGLASLRYKKCQLEEITDCKKVD